MVIMVICGRVSFLVRPDTSDTLGASDAAVMVHARVVYKFVTGLGSAVGATVVEVRLPARNELAMTLPR